MILQVKTSSLSKNIDKVEEIIYDIPAAPDMIEISETKLKENYPISFNLPGYDFVHTSSKTNAERVGLFLNLLTLTH